MAQHKRKCSPFAATQLSPAAVGRAVHDHVGKLPAPMCRLPVSQDIENSCNIRVLQRLSTLEHLHAGILSTAQADAEDAFTVVAQFSLPSIDYRWV